MKKQSVELFGLPLVQAVNDWQRGGDTKQSRKRGQTLKRAGAFLPEEFRQCSLVCHRQVALTKSSVWKITAEAQLEEKISAWTVDIEVAKNVQGWSSTRGTGISRHNLFSPSRAE